MRTVQHHQTTIEAVPDLPVIRIVREFDAPAERVCRAHLDPDLVTRWLGPRGLTMQVHQWEGVTGGSYRYTHRDGDGGEYSFYGSFHEVRAPHRIVQTFTFEGFPDGVSLETLTLEDLDGGRCRLVATSLVDSIEARDAMIASGMETGITEGYEQLDDLLAEEA